MASPAESIPQRRAHAMAMTAESIPRPFEWTVELLQTLPDDGNRYELVNGELLVSPAPSMVHQRAALALAFRLRDYAGGLGLEVFVAPTAIRYSEKTEVQPDVLVIVRPKTILGMKYGEGRDMVLAIEVLSPYSRRADRVIKREEFQRRGLRDYWIVDLDECHLEHWLPGSDEPLIRTDRIEWQPAPESAPLVIDLPAYFASVLRDGAEE